MRRKKGALIPIEVAILEAAIELRAVGTGEFYGFMISKLIQDRGGKPLFSAQGTLYRALNRMDRAGLIESRWEDPEIAEAERRPRRRLYHVTAQGEEALERSRVSERKASTSRTPRRAGP